MSGQTLVIFALSLTVLLGLAGLTIDVARAYDLYARMLRAAEAGALAGVLYMPTYYNSVRPGDVDSAISRASKEVVKNGFGSVLGPTASACSGGLEVQICQSSKRPNDLKVSITETLQVVLLSGLGVQPVTLVATGQAEYLPPVQLGSRLNYFGDQVECSNVNPPDPTKTNPCGSNAGGISAAGNHLQYFLASIKGPATLKEEGDAYVYCEEGPAYPKSAADLDGTAYLYIPYNFINTWSNHQQYPAPVSTHCGVPGVGGNPGNPDQQPSGFEGPATANTAHPGGYNYDIVVPPNITNASLWIYNPSFIPQDTLTANGQSGGFDYFSNYPKPQAATGDGVNSWNGNNYDSPALYFTMTYSLYQTYSPYDRTTDQLLKSVNYPSYDGLAADKTAHGCTSASMVYDPYWQDYQSGGTYQTSGTTHTVNTYNHPGTITAGGGCLDLATGTAPTWNPTAPAACYMQWCQFPYTLSGGSGGTTYRFVVEATGYPTNVPADAASNTIGYSSNSTDGAGTHSYALKVCPAIGLPNPWECGNGASGGNPGVGIGAWNNFEAIFSAPIGQLNPDPTNPATSCVTSNATPYTCVDLGCIPTAYAGRKININLFDTADEGPDLTAAVTPPPGSGATVTYPSFAPTSTADGLTVVPGNPFNGLWLQAIATLPSTYTGNCQSGPGGTGWWQLAYTSASGAQPTDGMNAAFTLVGSPVHLVPPG